MTVTVAQYLARRLRQLGAEHLFGVPGDFTLGLLDSVLADGALRWVGSPNEQGAGYAADAYARTRGIAAVVTTFGVGELSAMNAVAGAYAEHVPLVQVTGAPPTSVAAAGAPVHHTLADGDFGRFARAYAEVTAAGAVLTAADAADRIDAVLATAVRELRPVYLSIPVDVATAPVSAARLAEPLPSARAAADPAALDRFRARAAELLAGAGAATVIAGHLVERTRTQPALARLAEAAASPVVTLASARGAFDPADPHYAGVYCGEIGAKRAILAVDTADVLIEAGTLMADTMTGAFTHRVDPAHTIHLGVTAATVAGTVIEGVPLATALDALAEVADADALRREPPSEPAHDEAEPRELDQAGLWAVLERWFPAGHRLVTDIGTTFFAAMDVSLPAGADVVAQPVWSSIGYALPATLGCALADPTRRPVLVVGDGAAQMTVQDLSTLAYHGAAPIVIIVDNAGYTIERAIQSPAAVYNDVPAWDWCALATAFAPGADILTARPATLSELDGALADATAHPDRMAVLHVRLDAMDVPPALRGLLAGVRT
ncbi:alpha-keto acid decarboxylase family protein [Pseudonocardia acaciae]|uniref:alpha-keto acid decarboxylase family protein n=1 Tax=Pseudonocardia acaciae TaxID=551276 RepID=UPI00048CBD4E|nr:thiamine pyrophosphate-binding protein [Pseudonocardia acaciae]